MAVDPAIVLGRLFGRVKEKLIETYKNLGERIGAFRAHSEAKRIS
jgi:hypothetical protein